MLTENIPKLDLVLIYLNLMPVDHSLFSYIFSMLRNYYFFVPLLENQFYFLCKKKSKRNIETAYSSTVLSCICHHINKNNLN